MPSSTQEHRPQLSSDESKVLIFGMNQSPYTNTVLLALCLKGQAHALQSFPGLHSWCHHALIMPLMWWKNEECPISGSLQQLQVIDRH